MIQYLRIRQPSIQLKPLMLIRNKQKFYTKSLKVIPASNETVLFWCVIRMHCWFSSKKPADYCAWVVISNFHFPFWKITKIFEVLHIYHPSSVHLQVPATSLLHSPQTIRHVSGPPNNFFFFYLFLLKLQYQLLLAGDYCTCVILLAYFTPNDFCCFAGALVSAVTRSGNQHGMRSRIEPRFRIVLCKWIKTE